MDYIVRGLVENNNVRVFGVSSTFSCRHGARDHKCTPLASVAFGRTISAGIMMGAMLKGEERLTIQINGNGPIGTLMVKVMLRDFYLTLMQMQMLQMLVRL